MNYLKNVLVVVLVLTVAIVVAQTGNPDAEIIYTFNN